MTQILDVTTSEDVCTRQRTKVLHYLLPDTNNRLLKSNDICLRSRPGDPDVVQCHSVRLDSVRGL